MQKIQKGDLVTWPQGSCDIPGLVLDTRLSKDTNTADSSFGFGYAVLAMMPELGHDPEWFHECELVVINEKQTN